MFCENCGANIEENAAVCTTCGQPVNNISGNNSYANSNSGNFNQTPPPASIPMPKKYCKNCGSEMNPKATICTRCGFSFGTGNAFCHHCGQNVQPGQAICIKCGCSLSTKGANATGGKSRMTAGLLGIFLGSLGIHNFYVGKTTRAVIQLVVSIVGGIISCGIATLAMWIWGLVEGIFFLTGHEGYTTDANGVPLSE